MEFTKKPQLLPNAVEQGESPYSTWELFETMEAWLTSIGCCIKKGPVRDSGRSFFYVPRQVNFLPGLFLC